MKPFALFCLVFLPFILLAQDKKILDHAAYDEWHRITKRQISNDGKYVTYSTKPNGYGNEQVGLHDIKGQTLLAYERGANPVFTNNAQYLIFKAAPDFYAYRDLKRQKTKKKDLPGDTLMVYSIKENKLDRFPRLKSFKVPQKWDDYLIYMHDPVIDSTRKHEKKRNKKNGYDLVVRNLKNGSEVHFPNVLSYAIAEEGPAIAAVSTGNDSTHLPGVYTYNFKQQSFDPVFRSKGKYQQLVWDKKGEQLSFLSDTDTTNAQIRDMHLQYYKTGWDSSQTVVQQAQLKELIVNKDFKNYFSESGKRLFFQTKEFPVLQDTALLDEEIVNVEVWNTSDQVLFTQQENQRERDLKFGYLSYYDVDRGQFVQLGRKGFAKVEVSDQGDGSSSFAIDDYQYRKLRSWEGYVLQDLYDVNVKTGESIKVAEAFRGFVNLSPKGTYAYWYNNLDSAWFTYSFKDKQVRQITTNAEVPFYNEIHDTPSAPRPYRLMAWTENDERLLLYDRYDIWAIDPMNQVAPKRLTEGRSKKLVYRYIRLDREERFISKGQALMLSGFYESDKRGATFKMVYAQSAPVQLIEGPYRYRNVVKARDADRLIFTRENFEVFPDIHAADLSFKKTTQISTINPQQDEYNWGTIELVYWTSLEGEPLEGMLVKPENFDPSKKYPLLVNFYEKSSNNLHRHRDPYPHRSTINYPFYTSRGYVIFNPNVHYGTGYPGEDAYNCVIPGVTSLLEKGFIDPENIGVQGHSWGGYQIAQLITETDIFKCAEAGAPVVNMISAYGGIRWGSGLSRMFQYEHTQSRLGGSLWEVPLRFVENSPIFTLDKVNTPVLIMHNDEDGAVPWYQGIEYFVGLRRLGKPAWMLNYRGEPHWPLKIQNRIDFNIRMAQFFDHYLLGQPMPKWMRDGVPATELGIEQGLELIGGE
ncbi:MAG: prolyl oligopeptidase family serine peptidase [Bacteroidota bacterium]